LPAEAFRQDFHDAMVITTAAKPNHIVIRIPYEKSTLTLDWLLVLLEPAVVVAMYLGAECEHVARCCARLRI
jgi:hypothetical protein